MVITFQLQCTNWIILSDQFSPFQWFHKGGSILYNRTWNPWSIFYGGPFSVIQKMYPHRKWTRGKFIEAMVLTFKLQPTNCVILSDQFCTFFNGVTNPIIKYGSFSMEVHVISDTGITVVTVGRQISAGPVMVISA